MHTISQSGASESVLTRVFLLLWSIGELIVAVAVHALLKLVVWQERARERRSLASLDDRMLHDIGLSRSQVEFETSKPFWHG